MKSIIIYYSLDGNTKAAAERFAEALGSDICALEPERPLPGKGFKKFFVCGRQASFGETPALKKLPVDPKDYDLIILGTPIWAGKCSSPVWSFVKNCEVCDRIKAVFTLSGGGDNIKCIHQLEKKLKDLRVALALHDKNCPAGARNESKIPIFIEAVRIIMADLSR